MEENLPEQNIPVSQSLAQNATPQLPKSPFASKILLSTLILLFLIFSTVAIYFLKVNTQQKNLNKSSKNEIISIDTTGWDEYQDKLNGYSIKYPTEYYADTSQRKKDPFTTTIFKTGGKIKINITTGINLATKDFSEKIIVRDPPILKDCKNSKECTIKYLKKLKPSSQIYGDKTFNYQKESEIQATVLNEKIKGVEYVLKEINIKNVNEQRFERYFITGKDGKIFVINISQSETGDDPAFTEDKESAYQVLSTFKSEKLLTNAIEWKTFHNEDFNYELKYPSIGLEDAFISDFYFFPLVSFCTQDPQNKFEYQVKKTIFSETGDNLWDIARIAYGSGFYWPELAKANGITNPELQVEPGKEYTVPPLKTISNLEKFFVINIFDWNSNIEDFMKFSFSMGHNKTFCNIEGISEQECIFDNFYKFTKINNSNAEEAYIVEPTSLVLSAVERHDCGQYNCQKIFPMFSEDYSGWDFKDPKTFLYKKGGKIFILQRSNWVGSSSDYTKGCNFINENDMLKSGTSLKFLK
jgi:hypothetical protein